MSGQKTLHVATELGDVTVKKLALGDYAVILRALDVLPKRISELFKGQGNSAEVSADYFISLLPAISADALPELASVLASCTDKKGEFILKLDLADTIDVLDAALELNDYSRIAASIKKIMTRRAATSQPQPGVETTS